MWLPVLVRTLSHVRRGDESHLSAHSDSCECERHDSVPTPELVNQYFNDSTGTGDRGEPDARGPWNEGGDWELVTAPAFQELESPKAGTRQAREFSGANGGNAQRS